MDFEKQRERELERKEHGRLGGYVDPEHPEKGVYFTAPDEEEAARSRRRAGRSAAKPDADAQVIDDAHVGAADQKIDADEKPAASRSAGTAADAGDDKGKPARRN